MEQGQALPHYGKARPGKDSMDYSTEGKWNAQPANSMKV